MTQLTQPQFRLAHYIPMDDKDHSSTTKLDIVLSALLFADALLDVTDLEESIRNHLGCEIPKSELIKILKEGEQNGFVNIVNGKYLLDHSTKGKMISEKEELEQLQENVITKWVEEELSARNQDLTGEEKEELSQKVLEFVTNVFLTHGIQSMNLLIDEVNSSGVNFSINQFIDDLHFEKEKTKNIAFKEFPKFLSSEDPNVVSFLLSIINKSIRYLTTICDPRVIDELKQLLNGKVIYLDSSTVYRLLNLQGENRYHVVNEVVNLCKEFGIILKVSAMTLDELKRRIEYDSRVLKNHPVPVDLESFGYNYFTDDNFISTFWEQKKRIRITVDQFIMKYKNIDLLLEAEGLEVEKTFPKHDDEFVQRKDVILEKFKERAEFKRKRESAAEHDAYMFALVDMQKGDKVVDRFIESPAWFLTTDSFLIRFQKQDYGFKGKSPIALYPAQLLNVLRFTKPSEQDFDKVFLEIFSKGFHSRDSKLNNEDVVTILSRIARYNGYTPMIAQLLLSDDYFVNRYRETKEQDGEIEGVIHDSLIEKAKDMEKILSTQAQETTRLANDKQKLENETSLNKEEIEKLRFEVEQSQRERSSSSEIVNDMMGKIDALQTKIEQYEKDEQSKREKSKKRKDRILTITYIVCFLLIGYFCYYLYQYIFNGKESLYARRLIVTAAALGLMGLFNLVLPSKRAKKIANSIFLGFAGIAGCVWALVS